MALMVATAARKVKRRKIRKRKRIRSTRRMAMSVRPHSNRLLRNVPKSHPFEFFAGILRIGKTSRLLTTRLMLRSPRIRELSAGDAYDNSVSTDQLHAWTNEFISPLCRVASLSAEDGGQSAVYDVYYPAVHFWKTRLREFLDDDQARVCRPLWNSASARFSVEH